MRHYIKNASGQFIPAEEHAVTGGMAVGVNVGAIGGPFTEGEKTNPAADLLVADTGALAAGTYECRLLFTCSAAAAFSVQRRNAANGANVGNVIPVRFAAAAGPTELVWTFTVAVNERIRVVMAAELTGVASAVIGTREV